MDRIEVEVVSCQGDNVPIRKVGVTEHSCLFVNGGLGGSLGERRRAGSSPGPHILTPFPVSLDCR